jgi:very-short-patch-repair endonuclease
MIEITYNHPNRKNARRKLRQTLTQQETALWFHLRNNGLGVKFKRQYGVSGYIVDFYCPTKRLVIELDGQQHLENKEYDEERTKLFKTLDIKVVRFWNAEIDQNIKEVLVRIKEEL